MRFFFIDNGLRSKEGHHFILTVGAKETLERLGHEVRIYCNLAAPREVLERLDARPLFPHAPYDRVSRDNLADPVESMLTRGPIFAECLKKLYDDGLTASDVIWHPSFLHCELFGWSGFLRSVPKEQVPHIFLNACMDWCHDRTTGQESPGHQVAYRVAGRALACAPNGSRRLTMTCHSADYAEQLARMTSHRVLPFPHFQRYGPRRAISASGRRRAPGSPVRVAMLGQTRPEKGFAHLPEVIARTDSQPGMLSYLIQAAPADMLSLWEDRVEETLARPSVDMVYGVAGPEDHMSLLERTEILLLSYNPDSYQAHSSNLFGDAVSQGIVSVVSSGSWMANKIAEGAASGVIYDGYSAEAIAPALLEAAARFPELQAKADSCVEA